MDERIHKVIPPALSVPSAVLVSTHIPLFLFVVLALASSAQSEISRHQAVVCHSIVRRQRHTEARQRGKLVFMSGRSWRKSTFFSDLLPVTWAISFIRHLTIEMFLHFLFHNRGVRLFHFTAILHWRRCPVFLIRHLTREAFPCSFTRHLR